MSGAPAAKPRLLVLASTYPRWPGDPEPGFVHELAKRLVDEFEVTVLGPHAPDARQLETMDGVRVVRYRYAPANLETLVNDGGIVTNLRRQPWKWLLVPAFLLGLAWHAWRLVRRWRPDVVHAHWLLPQGLAVALLRLVGPRTPPFVVTSHGADLFALRAPPLQALKRFVARRAGAITVVSSAMRAELARIGVPTAAVTVQPMGVDLMARFTPAADVERSRHELLFVGRMVEKKGLRYLIDAMPDVLQHHPDATLAVAGFGPEQSERKAQVERLGLQRSVRFLGAVTQAELPGLYRRATVFVAPFVEAGSGDQEGLGLVLVEAMGCGCPVVTTRIPAVCEVFGEWPDHIATPGSAASLAARIVQVLDDPVVARAGVESRLPALRARFDHAPVAAGYAALLRATIAADRPAGGAR